METKKTKTKSILKLFGKTYKKEKEVIITKSVSSNNVSRETLKEV